MEAPEHNREVERLAALNRAGILDSAPESVYDDVVRLASQICEAPISLVSLVDADRQWFKARVGLELTETPREQAICAHAINAGDFLELSDTTIDWRSADNPLVTEDGLRFYAGAVLKSCDGLPLGTLCVLDTKPRQLTELQKDALRVLAKQVETQITLRETIAREEVLRREIDHRVKNSLQSVGSFIAIERRHTKDEQCVRVLSRVEQQVRSVAQLHQQIGTGQEGDGIDLGQYLTRIVELFNQTCPPEIAAKGEFAAYAVTAKQASTLAMIVNELGANVVKHSFGDREGEMSFTGVVLPDGSYQLTCSDNGTAPDAAEASPRTGMGLQIIDASVRQLGGTVTSESSARGYRTVITARL